ncbi:hypothetical protein TWF481_002939 [Arthrobotrys musiformis]|uniref:BAR domain-containing protein n=1 Tax=Arthrobotrys musiformis TaxID=47236 RepID=A0AAV9VRU9_9PEZI
MSLFTRLADKLKIKKFMKQATFGYETRIEDFGKDGDKRNSKKEKVMHEVMAKMSVKAYTAVKNAKRALESSRADTEEFTDVVKSLRKDIAKLKEAQSFTAKTSKVDHSSLTEKKGVTPYIEADRALHWAQNWALGGAARITQSGPFIDNFLELTSIQNLRPIDSALSGEVL